MIKGIGTDIVEIERIKKAIESNPNFINRFFTEKEIEYFKLRKVNANTISGNFAAKEAVSKALGSGFRGFGLMDIEVLRDELGKPIVNLSDKLYKMFNLDNYNIFISISHSNTDAIAYAIIEVI
ncbi:holo-ACP synthase [Clostridium botulinum]|uniref:holo-ACP synthase n=1 Tax=Clostridium botulinum TaxID=1491 RepID=UPI0013F0CC30|nr:holo-ACP synthase [Clostridium botulinum]MBY6837598.1 holo-ACP synthase [Clostridium botulinum]NFG64623.1 holo-ACP synthase [Clostridium botulinum]NFL36279.1 holo-ACP synthase [Clostridium botulinum]NFM04955.1 holo-ACP synthase [Clostridium botulinum]NFQ25424.1 holo-ACP synthase [Clostridium botulinum]